MNLSFEKLQTLDWQRLNRLDVVILTVLILCLCWKLASIFWWVVAPPQAIQIQHVELGSQQVQIPNISQFSLFNEPAATTANDNVSLELQGVMLGYPEHFSSAVIKVNEVAERYRVGENVADTSYQLAEVYWDHVILRQGNGVSREIRFKGMENGLYQPTLLNQHTSNSSSTSVPASNQTAQSALGQAIEQIQENRDQYLQNMGISGGNHGGYEVTERTPSVLRNKLGLRPGDRIVSLNGQTVGPGQSEVQILEQARREGQVKLEIKRGDQVMTIQQNFQ